MRFALLELKVTSIFSSQVDLSVCIQVALAMIVRHLELVPGTKTAKPLELDKAHAFAWIKGGLWASVKKRDTTDM